MTSTCCFMTSVRVTGPRRRRPVSCTTLWTRIITTSSCSSKIVVSWWGKDDHIPVSSVDGRGWVWIRNGGIGDNNSWEGILVVDMEWSVSHR